MMIPGRIFLWLLTVMAVSVFSIILSQNQAMDPFQAQYMRLVMPLETLTSDLANPISDFWNGATDHGDLVRQNQELREEIERLQAEVASREDASQRIQELQQLLQVKEARSQDQFVVADVIAFDPSSVRKLIALNRGTSDGIQEGMVVLSAGGSLVGSVSQAFSNFAWVELITDADSVVNAQVQLPGGTLRGVVQGDPRHGLSLQMVSPERPLLVGALVTTSGLGGNYPVGLLIGSIRSIDERPQAASQQGVLEPAASMDRLRSVLVITSFKPARLQAR